MTPHPNTTRLKDLMARHRVSIKEVAQLLGRSSKTVRMWRSKTEPSIPDTLLELLELKLKAAEKAKSDGQEITA